MPSLAVPSPLASTAKSLPPSFCSSLPSSSICMVLSPFLDGGALHGTYPLKGGIRCNDLQIQYTFSCLSESALRHTKNSVDEVILSEEHHQRPYVISFGDYVVQEAVLDEEYWAAAWLRAEVSSEGRPYFRYIDSFRKRFAEQEYTALKRRCSQKHGQCVQCICLVAIAPEGSQIGGTSQRALRDRLVGTLDISIRQLLRGERFPKEAVTQSPFSVLEPERQYGYIANVCITSTARRRGIASNLLEVAVKVAKSWKLKKLYVHVGNTNTAAQRLYKKTGFQVVEDYELEYPAKHEQLLYMGI